MTVPVVADIGFDLRRLPIHLSMMVAMIVDCIEAVRSPYEPDVMAERATNSLAVELVVELVVVPVVELAIELGSGICYQPRHHR